MKKIVSIILSLGLLVGIIYIFGNQTSSKTSQNPTSRTEPNASIPIPDDTKPKNILIKDGVQYITIDVKWGYFPRVTIAKGDIPTKLIAKTAATYDCSSALVIRAVGYQSYLPATGETEIDLGTPKSDTTLDGTCSMGMYNFQIKFMK